MQKFINREQASSTPCPKEHFKCSSGQCVHQDRVMWVDNEEDQEQLGSEGGCNDATDVFYADSSPLELFCYHNRQSDRCIKPMALTDNPDNPNSNDNNNNEDEKSVSLKVFKLYVPF